MRQLICTAAVVSLAVLNGYTEMEQDQPVLTDPVVGRWAVADEDEAAIEFLADGTVDISEGSQAEQGRWERLQDGRILLEVTGTARPPGLSPRKGRESGRSEGGAVGRREVFRTDHPGLW